MVGGMVGSAAGTTTISTTSLPGGAAAPLAQAMTIAAGKASAKMSRGTTSADSVAANGASLLSRVGGSNVGAPAASMASYGLAVAAPINAGRESNLAFGPDRVANQHRPRPWQPVVPPPKAK